MVYEVLWDLLSAYASNYECNHSRLALFCSSNREVFSCLQIFTLTLTTAWNVLSLAFFVAGSFPSSGLISSVDLYKVDNPPHYE